MSAAILAGKHLAQVGTGPQMHGLQGVRGHRPDRAVDGARQLHFLPMSAVVFADQQSSPVAWRAVAIGEKHHAGVVESGHDGAGVLPGGVDRLKLPMQSAIAAAVQALVGGGVHQALVMGLVKDGDAMHIRRNQSLIACVPGVTVVMADKDTANLDCQPHRVCVHGIEQNLRDPRGPHVDGGELLQVRHAERLPSFTAVTAATDTRRAAAHKPQLGVLRMDGRDPDVLQGGVDGCPTCRGLIPMKQTYVGASQQPLWVLGVARKAPYACFEVHA